MTYSHISGAEEFACELLRAAEKKASAIASAGHPPLPTFESFATSSFPEGTDRRFCCRDRAGLEAPARVRLYGAG